MPDFGRLPPEKNIRKWARGGQEKYFGFKVFAFQIIVLYVVLMIVNYADEARIFFSVQISRYLRGSGSRCFSGPAEQDAVMGMIRDAWVELRASGSLDSLSSSGRRTLYASTLIVFPTFVADGAMHCIPVDFVHCRKISSTLFSYPLCPDMDA